MILSHGHLLSMWVVEALGWVKFHIVGLNNDAQIPHSMLLAPLNTKKMRWITLSSVSFALRMMSTHHTVKSETKVEHRELRSHEKRIFHAQPVKLGEQRLVVIGHIVWIIGKVIFSINTHFIHCIWYIQLIKQDYFT